MSRNRPDIQAKRAKALRENLKRRKTQEKVTAQAAASPAPEEAKSDSSVDRTDQDKPPGS